MKTSHLASVSITEADLKKYLLDAQALVNKTNWRVENKQTAMGIGSRRGLTTLVDISLRDLLYGIDPEDEVLTVVQNSVLRAVRRGLQVGLHMASAYRERALVDDLKDTSHLSSMQLTQHNEKMQTASAIAQFTTARYVLWHIEQMEQDSVLSTGVSVGTVDVSLTKPTKSLKHLVFFVSQNIQDKVEGSDDRLLALVTQYMEGVQEEITNRLGSLTYTDVFTNVSYQLEDENFSIHGFEIVGAHKTVEIKEVYPKDIIGNTQAVSEVEFALRKLFLYDFDAQLNPIKELGGFQSVMLLSGNPGNGKTQLLSVARTIARDYAQSSGLPYRDLVVPDNLVSKYQGQSGPQAVAYIESLRDPRFINLGIGDEIEQVLPDHGGDDVSEGDRAVAVAFLKGLSGVSSVDRLNFLLLMATNYPENIDKAFMSRIKSRYYVTGAETMDDYVRFMVLNLRELNAQYPNLVNIKGIDWDMDTRIATSVQGDKIIVDPTWSVADIHEKAASLYDRDDVHFFASFFWMMKQRQATFSLRDCANTIDGTKAHVAGFKVPEEWITEQRHYIELDSEAKRGVITELAVQHVEESGINFTEMLDKQAVQYAEEALRMAETQRNRAVEEAMERGLVAHLAEKRLKAQLTGSAQ